MRLQFLKKFIEKQSTLFVMSVEPSTANAKVKKDQGIPGAHLVNQEEKWLCSLCSNPHKSDRGQSRKFYFHETCSVFKHWDPTRKSEFFNKNKLCRVYSCKLNGPTHKKPCDKVQRIQCTICFAKGRFQIF